MTDAKAIGTRLADIRQRIDAAAERAGRDPASVRLVAVSKTFGADAVRAAADAGHVDFGENKVQEGLSKMADTADLPLTWHLIGHLQSNKANKASAFGWFHAVDSADLLVRLDRAASRADTRMTALVQVDLAGEATKHGAPPDSLRAIFDAAAGCDAVSLTGLMLLPPFADAPEAARPWFVRLRDTAHRLVDAGVAPSMLRELSMGMSHDFEIAVEEGATIVRVGTAIFGAR